MEVNLCLCELYTKAERPSLNTSRYTHWSICAPNSKKNESHYALSSSDKYNLTVPRVRTEMEKRAFSCATLSSWNNLQTHLKTSEFVSIETICSIPNNVHLSAHVFFYLVLYFKDVLQTSQVIHENDISIWMGLYVVK